MEVFSSISAVRREISKLRLTNRTIGLVPTMGSLHEGHLALVKRCREESDITISTIYVNPTQFNNQSDLKDYPRDLNTDLALLKSHHCDIVFTPQDNEMYPYKPGLSFDFGDLESVMEGRYRPGHFKGVGIVVSKLFNIIQPDRAYFGKKDLQQLMIIRQIVRDLNFGIEIVGVSTVREESGLAMSSRNERLNTEQRKVAGLIFMALKEGVQGIRNGMDISSSREAVLKVYSANTDLEPEYVEFVDLEKNALVNNLVDTNKLAICTAAYIGEVRLIDNIIFEIEGSQVK